MKNTLLCFLFITAIVSNAHAANPLPDSKSSQSPGNQTTTVNPSTDSNWGLDTPSASPPPASSAPAKSKTPSTESTPQQDHESPQIYCREHTC
jgi:hypothetical protein